jgi:hypothetical protein
MPYTPYYSQGIKFIKIARIDEQGNDNTLSLQELNNIRLKFNDVGIVEYPITSISKYDSYFLFGVETTNQTSSTDNEILNYRFSSSFFEGSNYPKLAEVVVKTGTYGAYSELYDNLNYFDGNEGTYTFNNQPNTPITFLISSSFTGSLVGTYSGSVLLSLYKQNTYSGFPSLVTSSAVFLDSDSGNRSGKINMIYTETPVIGDSFYLSLYTNNTGSLNIKNFIVTQSTNPQSGISDLLVLEPFIDEDFATSDYNVLAGDVLEPRVNPFYMDVDYSSNAIQAVNQSQIISGSATRATVQQSNYTDTGWVNARYIGTKNNSINYNTYTSPTTYTTSSTSIFGYNEYWPGDQAYGKQAAVDVYRNYFAKFTNITSSSPEIPGGSKIYITELIDINGNRYTLGQDQYTLDVAYNFSKGTNLSIYNITSTSASLLSSASIIDGGAYFRTILLSYNSSIETDYAPTFRTYYGNPSTSYADLVPYSTYHNIFIQYGDNTLVAGNSEFNLEYTNWLYPFLTSSYNNYPLSYITVLGTSSGIYDNSKNSITYGLPDDYNFVLYPNAITPIKPFDYIRLGVTGSSFINNTSLTSSYTYQISEVNITGSLGNTGSLSVYGTVTNLPTEYGQAYIIYRRVPSDSYITINKQINLNSSGLIIPANFNPAYDPIQIARNIGII